MKNIILYHHLGLGDHFLCNGLVHKVSEKYDNVYLACKKHNYETVKYLYSESPKIKIFKIHNNEYEEVKTFSDITNIPILAVGFQYVNHRQWDKSFYDQLDIDFSEKYNSFHIPKNPPKVIVDPPKEEYILVHNEASVGKYDLNIETNLKVVEIKKGVSDNLFSYIDIIKNASEIHCINSSLFHLIDNIPNITNKLYYHDVRKGELDPTLNYKWQRVNYD